MKRNLSAKNFGNNYKHTGNNKQIQKPSERVSNEEQMFWSFNMTVIRFAYTFTIKIQQQKWCYKLANERFYTFNEMHRLRSKVWKIWGTDTCEGGLLKQ